MTDLKYYPDADNCADMPGCGNERVLFTYYGEPAACCPRCYENIFAAPPGPGDLIVTIDLFGEPCCPNCGQPIAGGFHASENLEACPVPGAR